MTAVHNSNPDAGRECIAVNRLKKFSTCLGLSVAQKGLGDVGGNKLDRCLWQMQGERLSVSCAELRTAVSKARRANRGQETMGFDVRRPTARNVHCL